MTKTRNHCKRTQQNGINTTQYYIKLFTRRYMAGNKHKKQQKSTSSRETIRRYILEGGMYSIRMINVFQYNAFFETYTHGERILYFKYCENLIIFHGIFVFRKRYTYLYLCKLFTALCACTYMYMYVTLVFYVNHLYSACMYTYSTDFVFYKILISHIRIM